MVAGSVDLDEHTLLYPSEIQTEALTGNLNSKLRNRWRYIESFTHLKKVNFEAGFGEFSPFRKRIKDAFQNTRPVSTLLAGALPHHPQIMGQHQALSYRVSQYSKNLSFWEDQAEVANCSLRRCHRNSVHLGDIG